MKCKECEFIKVLNVVDTDGEPDQLLHCKLYTNVLFEVEEEDNCHDDRLRIDNTPQHKLD